MTATDSSKKERKDSDGAEKNKEASEEPASGTRDKFDNDIVHTNCESPNPSQYLFDKIFRSDQSISVPVSWGKINFLWGEYDDPAMNFQKLIGRIGKNGHVESACQKEIILDKTMTLLIKVNGVYVDHKEFGIESNELSSVENLEQIIKVIDERRVCQGSSEITRTSVNEHLLGSFTYRDKIDSLGHNQCRLLLPLDEKVQNISCKACKSIRDALNEKIIRRQRNKNSKYLKVEDLSPRKRERLLKLKKQLRSQERTKQRAQGNARMYKGLMHKIQNKMMSVTEKTLDDFIDKNLQISQNERTSIHEIFKAAKSKSPKARRYSDEWIILCILLHMRSPVTYRMIRDMKILPFPCERTIRK